jgi:hypothetical protein
MEIQQSFSLSSLEEAVMLVSKDCHGDAWASQSCAVFWGTSGVAHGTTLAQCDFRAFCVSFPEDFWKIFGAREVVVKWDPAAFAHIVGSIQIRLADYRGGSLQEM